MQHDVVHAADASGVERAAFRLGAERIGERIGERRAERLHEGRGLLAHVELLQ